MGVLVAVVVAALVTLGASSAWYLADARTGAPVAEAGSPPGNGPTSHAPRAPSAQPPANPTGRAPAPDAAPGGDHDGADDDVDAGGSDHDGGDGGDGGDVTVEAEVGDCIALHGARTNPTAEPAHCGSAEANYVVVAKTETADQCPADVDQAFYETRGGTELGALCLDVDWVAEDCFELSDVDPQRVPCTTRGRDTVRIGETITGTDEIDRCPQGGFVYPQRRFVVCAQRVGFST